MGDWVGEGGRPGQGTGRFSFRWDLQKHVLVRRGSAEFPAAQGRPVTVHEDLMVIYPAPGSSGFRAVYFDNEGHVINYTISFPGRSRPPCWSPKHRTKRRDSDLFTSPDRTAR